MPTYRISAPKKRTKRGRQSSSRRRYRSPAPSRIRPIPISLRPHTFCERLSSDIITVRSEGTANGLFKSFNLDQVSQAPYYKALFEYYTINKVVVEFRYKGVGLQEKVGMGNNQALANEVNPIIYFKVDHNDISTDSLVLMKQSMKTHEKQLTNNGPNFTIQLKPAVQAEAYKSSIATTYIPKWGQQLSTDDGTVPHYGLKCYAVANTGTSSNNDHGQIEVTYKMYFTMKNNE